MNMYIDLCIYFDNKSSTASWFIVINALVILCSTKTFFTITRKLNIWSSISNLFIWAPCPCAQLYSLVETLQPCSPRFCAHIGWRYWSAKIDDISLWPHAREHWMVYNTGPGFLAVVWFGSSRNTQEERGTKSHGSEKVWSSINHSLTTVLPSYLKIWFYSRKLQR